MITGAQACDGLFEVDLEGETAVVTPVADLRELRYQEIEVAGKEVLAVLSRSQVRNVVVDLGRTDYFGSTALGFFLHLWEAVHGRGRLVFCNVSPHEREILGLAHLDTLWPVYPSREEAVHALDKEGSGAGPGPGAADA